jgi:hypothetical protein
VPKPLLDKLFDKLSHYSAKVGIDMRAPSPLDFATSIDRIPITERTSSPMHRAFYKNSLGVVHKWRGYLNHYERHLAKYRNLPVRILEIGVYKGGSLQMWRRYFGPDAVIFGIDINPDCAQYDSPDGRVRIGSQDDRTFLSSVVSEMGGIDVVIDDGSHIGRQQLASFEVLFPLLDPNGVYICEDTHTAYWRGMYEGGYRRKTNFIEKAKTIIDDLHLEFHGRQRACIKDACRTIRGIHFYNSMVVVEKEPQPQSMNLMTGGD